MRMDGRQVGKALADKIRPALRELGFQRFQGRHAWRRRHFTIDMITLPSMNAYIADGVGCTSYSFSCAAGVYYETLGDQALAGWPRDVDLSIRGTVGKTIRQAIFHPYGQPPQTIPVARRDRPDVWYVLEDGSNLAEVTDDALHSVVSQGVPFIDLMGDPRRAVEYLSTEQNRSTDFGAIGTLLLGTLDSPNRVRAIERLSALSS